MARRHVARLALGAALLLVLIAAAGLGWAIWYPSHDVLETSVEDLTIFEFVLALAAFGLFLRYRE